MEDKILSPKECKIQHIIRDIKDSINIISKQIVEKENTIILSMYGQSEKYGSLSFDIFIKFEDENVADISIKKWKT